MVENDLAVVTSQPESGVRSIVNVPVAVVVVGNVPETSVSPALDFETKSCVPVVPMAMSETVISGHGNVAVSVTSTVKAVTSVPAVLTVSVTVPLGVPVNVPVYVRPATCNALAA